MALNINGTTGISGVDGSVSAPALTGTDSNTGITFPSADTIKFATGGVERMQISNTGVTGAGKIIQIVNTTTQTEAETSGTTFLDTNLTASITPTAASSKILITISQQLSINTSDSGSGGGLNILRKIANGSFSIIEASPSNFTGPFSYFISQGGATTTNYHFRHNMTHVDSPTYTLGNAITYKTQMRLYAVGTSAVLRAQNDAANNDAPTSHIVLMEVAA
nr:endo-N-actetylneuraminidase [uncultured Mediterranean phage uvMED]